MTGISGIRSYGGPGAYTQTFARPYIKQVFFAQRFARKLFFVQRFAAAWFFPQRFAFRLRVPSEI